MTRTAPTDRDTANFIANKILYNFTAPYSFTFIYHSSINLAVTCSKHVVRAPNYPTPSETWAFNFVCSESLYRSENKQRFFLYTTLTL